MTRAFEILFRKLSRGFQSVSLTENRNIKLVQHPEGVEIEKLGICIALKINGYYRLGQLETVKAVSALPSQV